MLKTVMGMTLCLLLVISSHVARAQPGNKKIVHDAEHYLLEAQHREK